MKQGWEIKKLEEVCNVIGGGTPSKGNSKFYDGTIFWATVRDMKGDFIKDTEYKITEDAIKNSSTNIIPEGNVVIATRVGLGKVCLIENDTAINQDLKGIIPKKKSVLTVGYLFQWLKSISHLIVEEGTGATVQGVKLSFIKDLPIPIPPLPEQQSIVAILDEAFAAIAKAKENAERNLRNAKELFKAHLRSIFNQQISSNEINILKNKQDKTQKILPKIKDGDKVFSVVNPTYGDTKVTKTGGRDATLRHIPGELSLSVGLPNQIAKSGWNWSLLSDLARMESGHTPSRRHPEYWNGDIPWIGIQDARDNHGKVIYNTFQNTNKLGIENSSARVLPENTVCLSRTASVGYVVVLGRPMSTSQDFVNWICNPRLSPDFLKYLLLAEGREGLNKFSSGAVHQTIYFPEAKAFYICHPEIDVQKQIVRICDEISENSKKLEAIYQQKINDLEEMKKSILQKAFSGGLNYDSFD